MSWFVVDVEADNQAPSVGSMVCFGAVKVSDFSKTFYGKTHPLIDFYDESALAVSGFSRSQHECFDNPHEVMLSFDKWIKENSEGHPIFISDNPAFWFFSKKNR